MSKRDKAPVYPWAFGKEYQENALAKNMSQVVPPRLMWEMRGPPNTACKWLSCWVAGGAVYIVQTWDEGRSIYKEVGEL